MIRRPPNSPPFPYPPLSRSPPPPPPRHDARNVVPLEIEEYAHAAGRELAHQRGPFAHVQHGADLGPAQAGKPGRELERLTPAREVERDDELSHGRAPAPRAPGRADRRGRRCRSPRATRPR